MLDRGFHAEVLRRRLLAGDDDVDVIAAAKAVIRDRQQTIGVRRKIDANDVRLFIHDVVDEAGVLMREAVMVLAPDVRGEEIVERGDGAAPANAARHLQPFRVLIEHRVHDVNESFVAGEKSVTSGEEIAFEPALAEMFAENFHHAAIGRKIFIGVQELFHECLGRDFVDGFEAVGSGFVGSENPEVFVGEVGLHDIAKKFSEDAGCFRIGRSWLGDFDGIVAEIRHDQVPVSNFGGNSDHLQILENWMRAYRPEELFDEEGKLRRELKDLAPNGDRRMGANPHANGGLLLQDLVMPDFRDYAVEVSKPGTADAEATRVLGKFLRDVMKANLAHKNFRVFGPDETASNRLEAIYEVSPKAFMEKLLDTDENLSPDGRVMEVLSEHLCQGWLEGYLLTGRHGFFSCYEAFVHIVDSMFNQHAKWLKVTRGIRWRRPIASLNYLLTSHVWRQDHNGFTHQDPGFIDHVVNKKADIVRVYLPPDANSLLSVADHCLRSRNYVNVIVAGKQPAPQYLSMEAAIEHCTSGIGIWDWACTDQGAEPDVVMACAGDVPTLESLAAVDLLRHHLPEIKIRFVNVVDLMTLQTPSEHPHGISDRDFDSMFTTDKPVIFAYHGYPTLIHRLTYRRKNHANLHVHGYKEEGTITTPFDMTVLNELDRFHLAADAIDRVPRLRHTNAHAQQSLRKKLFEHKQYIYEHGDDMPEIRDWKWQN